MSLQLQVFHHSYWIAVDKVDMTGRGTASCTNLFNTLVSFSLQPLIFSNLSCFNLAKSVARFGYFYEMHARRRPSQL